MIGECPPSAECELSLGLSWLAHGEYRDAPLMEHS